MYTRHGKRFLNKNKTDLKVMKPQKLTQYRSNTKY